LRERGTEEVLGECLTENKGMAALAQRLGFEVSQNASVDTMSLRMALRA
jgi:acetyltransferase